MGGEADTDLVLLMLIRLWTPPLTAPLLLNININHLLLSLPHHQPGPVLLLAGGGDAGVRGVCLKGVVELGDVGQYGETVRAAAGHVRHVQEGGDAQPHLGCEESELAVPEKYIESHQQTDS